MDGPQCEIEEVSDSTTPILGGTPAGHPHAAATFGTNTLRTVISVLSATALFGVGVLGRGTLRHHQQPHLRALPAWGAATWDTIAEHQLPGTDGVPPSLYCFAVTLPSGNEPELLRAQLEERESLFACDEHAVFSNVTFYIGARVATSPIGGSMDVNYGGKWGTALNTDIFVRVWRAVSAAGRYWYHDWTVKVDPDAVFLPQRLRKVLLPLAGAGPMYVNNCEWGLHGPLEVLSRAATATFVVHMDRCEGVREAAMRWQPVHWKPSIRRYGGDDKEHTFGEDQYLRRCLRLLNIQKVDNFDLLTEPACSFKKADCASSSVAMHPFKTAKSYTACYKYAEAAFTVAPMWSQ
mmetsp:Transcript_71856/g.202871  ORF Transcript_71856/g.202871 Transcript_71856/m.202871 type:complete len:350 (+) Transcript_71856:61-1110(+)